MCDIFGFHLFTTIRHASLLSSLAAWELIHCFARATLDKVACKRFENLMGLHAHVGFAVLENLQ